MVIIKLFPILGLIPIVIGLVALFKPSIISAKVNKSSGSKKESYQFQLNPSMLRILGIVFILFGIMFTGLLYFVSNLIYSAQQAVYPY